MTQSELCDPIGDELGCRIGHGAVLYDTRSDDRSFGRAGSRALAHVTQIWKETESGKIRFEIWDGTHTHKEMLLGADLLAMFTPAGFRIDTSKKPTYVLTRKYGVQDANDPMTGAIHERHETDQ